MAIKTASDLNIFNVLCQTTTFVTCKELAVQKNADGQLVGKYFLTCISTLVANINVFC